MLTSSSQGIFQMVWSRWHFFGEPSKLFPNRNVPLPHLAMPLCLLLGGLSGFAFLPAWAVFGPAFACTWWGGVILLEL